MYHSSLQQSQANPEQALQKMPEPIAGTSLQHTLEYLQQHLIGRMKQHQDSFLQVLQQHLSKEVPDGPEKAVAAEQIQQSIQQELAGKYNDSYYQTLVGEFRSYLERAEKKEGQANTSEPASSESAEKVLALQASLDKQTEANRLLKVEIGSYEAQVQQLSGRAQQLEN